MNDETAGVCHTIVKCKFCRERFGTEAAFKLHKPKPADKRSRQLKTTGKVRRFLCASEKTMQRAGAWQGYAGIWWSVETGENDPDTDEGETSAFSNPQNVENITVISDKIATLATAIPENRKPHNHAGFSASVSKFRGRRA